MKTKLHLFNRDAQEIETTCAALSLCRMAHSTEGVFLAGHIVAMVAYCVIKLTLSTLFTNDWTVF